MNKKNASVAIIGAGASGSILAYQLVEKACSESDAGVTVFLIEKGSDFGPGLAYSTPLSSHILNMRADTLGVGMENPLHFIEWLDKQGNSSDNGTTSDSFDMNYPPRKIYGEYLRHILDSTKNKTVSSPCKVELISGEAVDIDHNGSSMQVRMADGSMLSVDNVVLAPGNFPSSFLHELKSVRGYIPYPWPVSVIIEEVPRDNPVCILGAGLSAIDTLLTLLENGHRGKIIFISRRGFLPKVQSEPSDYKLRYLSREKVFHTINELNGKRLPLDMIKELYFKEMEAAEEKGIDWLKVFNPQGSIGQILEKDISRAEEGVIPYQAALTSSGPMTGYLWNSLSIEDRMLFDSEYKTLWTVYRHPMPLINARKILNALNTGQLDIQSGCMCVRTCGEKGFEIDLGTRFGIPYTLKTPTLINATGQGLDVTKFNDSLLNRLIRKGLIEPHPNGGIYVDFDRSEVIGKNRDRIPGFFALGEITRGVHFFTNGIVPNMSVSNRIADCILRRDGT